MIKESIKSFVTLIYPPICKACEVPLLKGEEVLCLNCEYDLPVTNYHLQENNALRSKFEGFVSIDKAFALYFYKDRSNVQRLIHYLKYKDRPEVGIYLGKRYASDLKSLKFDYLIPIPLHPKKLKKRKYNQSECFAEGLGQVLSIPIDTNVLRRDKNIKSQTKKGRYARYMNTDAIFSIDDYKCLKGKKILLVDDVITSGATMIAAIRVLNQIEDVQISVASIACRID